VVHLLLAVPLLAAACLPKGIVERASGFWRVALAAALLWLAQLVSLLVSERREATVGALADGWLWMGAALAAVMVAASARRSSALHWPWVATVAAVGLLGAIHVYLGLHAVFGWLEPSAAPARFWAPFVNPNHFGSLMLLAFPVALGSAFGRGSVVRRGASGALALAMLAVVVASGSGLPLLLLGVQAVAIGTMVLRPIGLLGIVAVPFAVPMAMRWASAHGARVDDPFESRVVFWRTAMDVWLEHPFLGVGAGTFGSAVSPYRTDVRYAVWSHAHNDGVEWLVETGALGAVALIGAFLVLAPWRTGSSRFLRRLAVGLGGMGAFALYDFPMQIPALAMLTGTGIAWLVGSRQRVRATKGTAWIRAVLVFAAAAQLGGSAWQLRTWAVDRAAAALARDPADEQAASRLALLAPWRADRAVAEVRLLARTDPQGACTAARTLMEHHPHHAVVLELGVRVLVKCGRAEDATVVAEQLVRLTPWNPRSWGVRALAHTARAPTDAVGAWGDAVRAGVPRALEAGWAILPEGLYWADALQDASVPVRKKAAGFLLHRGDMAATDMLLSSILLEQPTLILRDAPTAMLHMGRIEDACNYMDRVWAAHPDDPWVRRRRPEVLEACGRWAEARDAWLINWEAGAFGLGAATRCESRVRGVDAAQRLWEQRTLLGRRVTPKDRLIVARMFAETQRWAECRSLLVGGDYSQNATLVKEAAALERLCTAAQ